MNEVLKAIKERRSVRRFKPDMPAREDLDAIIEAGLYAASGMNRQSAIILEITDKATRERLRAANAAIMGRDGDPFYGAPAIFAVLYDRAAFTGIYDGSLVLGNMMLAAHSLGLGSIWIHRAKEEFALPEWKKLLADLGAVGDYEGVGHLAVGYADGEAPAAAPRRAGRVFRIE